MSVLDGANANGEMPDMRPVVLRNGGMGAMLYILYFLLGHFTGLSTSADISMWGILLMVSFVLWMAVPYLAVRQYRNQELGGFITFRKAFMVGFLSVALANILHSLFVYVYATLIEPDFYEGIKEMLINFYGQFELPEEDYDRLVEQLEEGTTASGAFFSSLWMTLFLSAIYALITAAILQQRNPEIT